jgi:nucleoside-diphosphate-sugar epimerase
LGIWINQILKGEEIKVFGDGKQLRDFNYVDDVVDALLISAVSEEAYGQVFNLGSKDYVSLKDLAKLLIGIYESGSYSLVPFPPERKKIDIGDYYGDFRKIHEKLGWEPRTSLEEGIALSLDYYSKYGKLYWND